jgi:TPP-dependent 2-oxoacid decarboxylase
VRPKGVSTMTITIDSFLIDSLISLDVSRICGVPGDYNLEFFKLLASMGLAGCCRRASI